MTIKAAIQANVLNNGSTLTVAANATVTVRVSSTGSLATIYEDRAGLTGKANPFAADSNGFFLVYAETGRYDITVTTASGSQTFEDVIVSVNGIFLDDNGNLGVGTESPINVGSGISTIQSEGNNGGWFYAKSANVRGDFYVDEASGKVGVGSGTASELNLLVNSVPAGRLNVNGFSKFSSDGSAISASGSFHEFVQPSGTATALVQSLWQKAASGDNVFFEFYTETSATLRGSIDYNRAGGVLRYNTTSDETLKTEISSADPLESLNLIKKTASCIKKYYWNHDKTKKPQIGPFAQSLYKVFPGAVSVGGFDGDGRYKPWSVDKTAPVWHLVQVCAYQQKLIDDLVVRIEALESKK